MFAKLVNWFGLYTFDQYIERVKKADDLNRYIEVLERSVNGLPDNSKPIMIFGEGVVVSDIILKNGQQIIVSPSARYIDIRNIRCEYIDKNPKFF